MKPEGSSRVKSRNSTPKPVWLATTVARQVYPPPSPSYEQTIDREGTKDFVSESVAYEVHKGPPYKEGGPFQLRRYKLNRQLNPIGITGSYDYGYLQSTSETTGKVYADFSSVGLPKILSEQEIALKASSVNFPPEALEQYGTEALLKLNPLRMSKNNVVQSLVELMREGVPLELGKNVFRLLQGQSASKAFRELNQRFSRASARATSPSKVRKGVTSKSLDGMGKVSFLGQEFGSGYLAYQFGWLPVVNDIKNIVETYKKSEDLYRQIVRDNNKPIRRRVTLRKESTSSTMEGPAQVFYPADGFYRGPKTKMPSKCTRETVNTQRIWCVGRGRYFIPNVETLSSKGSS